MAAKASQVLDIPELLEAVLLKLDIRTSPAIQRALFFKPVEAVVDAPLRNPLLTELFLPFFDSPNRLRFAFDAFKELAMAREERLGAFKREDASWRRMLVQQPPARELGMWERISGEVGDGHIFRRKRYPRKACAWASSMISWSRANAGSASSGARCPTRLCTVSSAGRDLSARRRRSS
ncbi:hypothetical protein DL766_007465 [Monosporascus sp. MC13-8B]|uniref:Uncharacterized protein n=1 Tax=Monosporascus cannonballus TaxID=155416 RepID=A0ABY0GXL7_9PEZI|nr:hypothetical protein DL762_009579 [Monosporascus cannonballus]RYO82044.1 hypothetical protein DL763_008376 [Monosporascus cannonballus]RYP23756.1 hypothetical protein DL766_007465 [Monosporascus sp. MC13-8B]